VLGSLEDMRGVDKEVLANMVRRVHRVHRVPLWWPPQTTPAKSGPVSIRERTIDRG